MICKKLLENVKNPEVIPSATGYVDSTANSKNNGMVPLTNNPPKMPVIKRTTLEYGITPAHIRVKIDNDAVAPVKSAMTISFM